MFDQAGNQSDAPLRRNVRKPDESGVGNVVQVDELSEVGINRNENSSFPRGVVQ